MATDSKTTATLKYGESAELHLDFSGNVEIIECARSADSAESTAEKAAKAFASPLDFPPIQKATVPGDRIVLALSPGTPQAAEVIAALVPVLLAGGATAENITVVCTHDDVDTGAEDPRSRLPAPLREAVHLETHDAGDRDALSYLAADAQGEPIYMNRSLCDADLIIPIGIVRAESDETESAKKHKHAAEPWNDTLYPTFADRKTIDHFALNGVALSAGQKMHRQKQIDQAAWLLGVQITVQIVPGSGQKALAVLAGTPEAVFATGRDLCCEAWQTKVTSRADLVIAAVSGNRAQQTWANVSRALETALPLVNDGGAIVLCTELDAKVGPALRQLIDSGDSETTQHRLRKQRSPDAPLARLLIEAQDRVTIYLLSRLAEDEVTALGLAHVATPTEVKRLASHYQSCILISDAQYARPVLMSE